MHYKVYASDEGFGHLIRQSSILREFRCIKPDIDATIQTGRYIEEAKWIFSDVELEPKFNNVSWSKNREGMPDLDKIRAFYTDYIPRSQQFVAAESISQNVEFIVSDFVAEAFPIAARHNLPAFGVAHFTWDWFFSKLYPVPVDTDILERFRRHANAADILFFPPFTPVDIINAYRQKVVEVPLIVRKINKKIHIPDDGRFKILLMDSGANILSKKLKRIVSQLSHIEELQFFISEKFSTKSDNITEICGKELYIDYIPYMDLVISRAGFNTISECVAYRTPILLISESLNPEMEINMLYLKKEGLASFVSIDLLITNFREIIHRFIENEYKLIVSNMQEHEIPSNGAEVVANKIIEYISE